jgi:hypothetical protein
MFRDFLFGIVFVFLPKKIRMGYSGFGLQKWIFTQKARKPFSRKRGADVDNSKFNNRFSFLSGVYSKEEAINKISIRKRYNLVLAFVLVIFLLGFAFFFIKGIKKYEVIHKNSKNEIINSTQAESFFILKELGNQYFENKDFANAVIEFELAFAIKPDNEIKLKLLTCYENLCETDLSYCDKYNDLLNEN